MKLNKAHTVADSINKVSSMQDNFTQNTLPESFKKQMPLLEKAAPGPMSDPTFQFEQSDFSLLN